MKTQAEAVIWIGQQLNKNLDWPGSGYGSQCIDLACYYVNFLGLPIKVGNAADWWESGYTGNGGLLRLPYNTTQPHAGDIVTFIRSAGNGYSGHIAVIHDPNVSPGHFRSMDQNWYNTNPLKGSPCAWVDHQIDGYITGYLRPKFNGGNGMKVISDAAYKDFVNWKKTGMDLKAEKVKVMAALGLPSNTTTPVILAAIAKLKGDGTVLAPGKYIVQ